MEITLVDRRNHHLFQPLLYQVATRADPAGPDRSLPASRGPQAQERPGGVGRGHRVRLGSTRRARQRLGHPYQLDVEGLPASIDYGPAESTTAMFGGNSNWRGPLWFPLNYLVLEALERYHRFFGEEFTIEYPTRSGHKHTLDELAQDVRSRLISIFLVDADGRPPCFRGVEKLQTHPAWKGSLVFNEYFHGDNGAGLGASHQTGWTGVVADAIRRRDLPG